MHSVTWMYPTIHQSFAFKMKFQWASEDFYHDLITGRLPELPKLIYIYTAQQFLNHSVIGQSGFYGSIIMWRVVWYNGSRICITRHNSADSIPTSNLVCMLEVAIKTIFSQIINIAGIIFHTYSLVIDTQNTLIKCLQQTFLTNFVSKQLCWDLFRINSNGGM